MINKKFDFLVNKFHDCWLGPFKITNRCNDLVYEIFDAESGKIKPLHFNLFKASSRKSMRGDIGQNAPTRNINEESSQENVFLID